MKSQLPSTERDMLVFDLALCRERARERQLTDEDLTQLTGTPAADWEKSLTPHTLTAAALFALAHALDTAPESLLLNPGPARHPRHRPGGTAAAPTYTTVLHAALLQTGPVHPDDLASALGWPAPQLQQTAKELAARLEQHTSPHRLVHTDTTLHLNYAPDLLTAEQQQNLHDSGYTAASLSPGEASALTRLLHATAHDLPPAVPAEQLPHLTGRQLLVSADGSPAPHPDVLFALGLAEHPLPASVPAADAEALIIAADGTPPPQRGDGR